MKTVHLRSLVSLLCIFTVAQSLRAEQKAEKPKQFIYVLRLVPRLHADVAWTKDDKMALDRHFTRFKHAIEAGELILAGRTREPGDKTFGIAIFEAKDEAAAQQFMESDPAVVAGLMTAQLHPFGVALIRSAVSQGGEAEPAGGSKDEDGIKKVVADFADAWNKHDAKAFSMVFSEDADFTSVGGKNAHGRLEIEKHHAPSFATKWKESNQKIIETRIRFIKPDVAAVDARWELTGAKDEQGHERPPRKGLLSFVVTKEGGTWLITVMHNTELK
jgi:uncharacterized protein (TIGR02246 family)